MNQNRSVADARYKKLRALIGMEGPGGGGGGGSPLSRFRFIDGGTAGTLFNGAISEPYKTVGQFCAAFANAASVADASALVVGEITPSLAGYAENPAFPAYRLIELRANAEPIFQIPAGGATLDGNATWPNAAGAHAATLAILSLHNISISGSLTCTDDAGAPPSELLLSGDEATPASVGSLDAHTTAHLSTVTLWNFAVSGACNLGSTASSANLVADLSLFQAAVTANSIVATGCTFAGNALTVRAGSTSTFEGCTFVGTPTLTGGAGSIVQMDWASYYSFCAAGGALAGGAAFQIIPYAGFLSVPSHVAAGTNVVASAGQAAYPGQAATGNNLIFDLTGAQPSYATNPAPVAGERFRCKSGGVGQTSLVLTPEGGKTIEDPSNPGTQSAVAVHFAAGNGGSIEYQYDGVSAWYLVATV